MIPDEDDWQTKLEEQPAFIASQLRPGHTLTENDVAAIQAVLKEIDDREAADVDEFHNGRIAAFHEIGGQELADAVQRKTDRFIKNSVRKAMDKMDERAGHPTKVERLYTVLKMIADGDEVLNMLDPGRNKRLAAAALAKEAPE
jgi:hypothetical protein